jgi:hypothetical protein
VRNKHGLHRILGANVIALSAIILDIEETIVPYWTLHERGFAKTPEPGVENKNKRCQRAESE